MSAFALSSFSDEGFSIQRSLAYGGSAALNVAALLAMMIPLSPHLVPKSVAASVIEITWVPPPPVVIAQPVPPPLPLPVRPVHKVVATARVARPSPPIVPSVTPSVKETSAMAVPGVPMIAPSPSTSSATATPLEGVSLGYKATPVPAYPAMARRQHWEGTVVLRVLVDTDGHPMQVLISKSSGHRELDVVARDQVLAHWLFQPAVVAGHARQAWAQVPVNFSLGT
jgi:protein TonB